MGEKPIGRRVALGVIGAGLTGIVFGSHVQDAMERILGPITARDGTGLPSLLPVGRFRIYSVGARLYVGPMYGYKSCKWLEAIDVARGTPAPGYWEVRGYDVDGWVGRSNGRDDPAV